MRANNLLLTRDEPLEFYAISADGLERENHRDDHIRNAER